VVLDPDELARLDAYWRAANYLTVGQIYLRDNALLREPLAPEHIKPRLLGHWGTSPGLSMLWTHLDRIIRTRDADVVYIAGPGHGGPAIVANTWLEGTYSEVYRDISRDGAGMQRLFRQFSTPGGIPSHVSVPTPGSIHEGGELGYALVHAYGAVFDNPDLVVACVIGDGESETGPLSGSWQGIDFVNPTRDGAVLPILHLNGYKISGPTVLGRATDEAIVSIIGGYGYDVHLVEGDDPPAVHQELAATLDRCFDAIADIQSSARSSGFGARPRWPAIVMRTPKGWTGPKEVDGLPVEGTWRAHQVPITDPRDNPEHLAQLEEWMRSYRIDELFDADGAPLPEIVAVAPTGARRMGANPHANGGLVLRPLDLPDFTEYSIAVRRPGQELHESTRKLGELVRDIYATNPGNFRLLCPDETNSNRLGAVFERESRCLVAPSLPTDDHVSPDGRVMEILSEHNCEGWLEGYVLTGRHGLFATYEAFAMVAASMLVQHTKWLEAASDLPWREPIASLNVLLTSTCWRNDHNGFSHQGPGLIDTVLTKRGNVARLYFPPDANCLLSVADHCFRSRDNVNLIVIDKQPQLQWLDIDSAREHCSKGASIWTWAGSEAGARPDPDVILASAGDIPTMELLAAADMLLEHVPDLSFRVVNVVDLMTLFLPEYHPHGMDAGTFLDLFTADREVVFAFHGYPSAVHHVIHGRPASGRFHVRGYQEEGTTTTPFDMVVRNGMSRYHLVLEALRRARRVPGDAESLITHCNAMLKRHTGYIVDHLEDMPEVRDWRWSRA
jgi:xylulose-5-phosphate/fructose-6-phosphate phosphoketolase